MKYLLVLLIGLTMMSLFLSSKASALTMTDFLNICESSEGSCAEHPILQAYVGGSLDLIAVLDEQTEYLQTLYCKDPSDLFDVNKTIEFMESHQAEYAKDNAMLLVIRYLEENGGC